MISRTRWNLRFYTVGAKGDAHDRRLHGLGARPPDLPHQRRSLIEIEPNHNTNYICINHDDANKHLQLTSFHL
jgi:hypothetical protein